MAWYLVKHRENFTLPYDANITIPKQEVEMSDAEAATVEILWTCMREAANQNFRTVTS
jgi:hypothetical protein